jgi:hypothetical protein
LSESGAFTANES